MPFESIARSMPLTGTVAMVEWLDQVDHGDTHAGDQDIGTTSTGVEHDLGTP